MSTKVSFLVISLAIVLLPWLLWRIGPVRRVAPLAVVQILVGVALGPSGLGRYAPDLQAALFGRPVLSALDGVSSIGVLIYVFVTGLHVDGALLREEGRRLGEIALGSITVPLLFGAGAGVWMLHAGPDAAGPLGNDLAFVAAVAICVAVTALPVLAAVLQELKLLQARIGQAALAIAAINDAALWVMLAVLLALAGPGGRAGMLPSLGGALLWFGLMFAVVRPLLLRLVGGRAVPAEAGDRAVLVLGIACAILSAAVSEAFGTGYLIGAFVAGAVMPHGWRASLLARLEPVTATVLLPFFFMSTGLKAQVEPGSASFLSVLAVATTATVLGKLAGTALPARRAGFSWADSLSLGVMMQTKGLMEVVVLSALHDGGMIGSRIFSGMVAMAVICTVLTAPCVRLLHRMEARRDKGRAAAEPERG